MVTEKIHTPEEVLRTLALQNRGTQNFFQKDKLSELCQQRGLEVPEKASKAELYDLLASVCSLEELEELGGMGLPSLDWQVRFRITGPQVRRLARLGLMRRTGTERFRRFGRYLNGPLYSVVDFFRLTEEEVTKAVVCRMCHAMGPTAPTKADAIRRWNQRGRSKQMKQLNLYDKYSGWLRNASDLDDVELVMDCVSDDTYNGALSGEEAAQLRELAENVSAALLSERSCV